MKRRSFLTGAAAGGAVAAASTLPAPAISEGRYQLKMATSWPKNFPGLGTSAQRLAKRISDGTGGRIAVTVFAGGEQVHALKCNDAVQQGVADMYHSADYYYGGKARGYLFFASVPFGLMAHEFNAWIQWGGGQKLWDEVGAQFGVKHFPAGNTGSQMGGWYRKPIKSVSDFKGLKMAIPGLGGALVTALGGTAVTLGGAEIVPALKDKKIDAAEWAGPWGDLALGLQTELKNYYYPGFLQPGTALSCGVSKKLWDKLQPSDRALIESACLAENDATLGAFNANNMTALNTLRGEHNVELHEFSDKLIVAAGTAAKAVIEKSGAADPPTKKILDSYLAFRSRAIAWTRLSDQAYANKRALVKL